MTSQQKKLVKAAISGDGVAFEKLIEQKRKEILYIIASLTSLEEAEDIAQEAMIHAYRGITTLKDPEKFDAWLYTLIRNDCYRIMGKRTKDQASLQDPQEGSMLDIIEEREEFLPATYLEDKEKREQLVGAIKELPLKNRECLLLFYYESMSYKEISDILNIDEKAVANALNRARALLKEKLQAQNHTNLSYSVAGVAAFPVLSEVFQLDAQHTITQAMCDQLSASIHLYIAGAQPVIAAAASTQASTSAGGTSAGATSIGGVGSAKIAIGVIAALVIGAGAFGIAQVFADSSSKVQNPTSPAQTQIQNQEVPESLVDEQQITNLDEMIGAQEALQLEDFATQGVSEETWINFALTIEVALYAQSTTQAGTLYEIYKLDKQDKRLMIFTQQTTGAPRNLIYQFGMQKASEIPRMTSVVLEFEERN